MIPADLRDFVIAGLSDTEIADKLGVSARTVQRWRKRAGLPSMWTPYVAPCGTESAYKRGCGCLDCRRAHADAQARTRAVYAALTRRALRGYETWSVEDDTVLLEGPGTLAERAQRLHRTYEACRQRLALLRRQERVSA